MRPGSCSSCTRDADVIVPAYEDVHGVYILSGHTVEVVNECSVHGDGASGGDLPDERAH